MQCHELVELLFLRNILTEMRKRLRKHKGTEALRKCTVKKESVTREK